MHKFSALFFLVSIVRAIDFYITSPVEGTKWTAGDKAVITWDIIEGGPNIVSVAVDLLDGDSYDAKVVTPIARFLPVTAKSVEWIVPSDIKSTDSVFVRVRDTDFKIARYSHRFAIIGDSSPVTKVTPKPSKTQNVKATSTRENESMITGSFSDSEDEKITSGDSLGDEDENITETLKKSKNEANDKQISISSYMILMGTLLTLAYLP